MQTKPSMHKCFMTSLAMAFLLIAPLFLPIPLQADDTDIVINEIMYDPDGTDDGHEWIEIYNRGATSVDLTGWKFYEDDTNHDLTLNKGSMTIPSGGYAVIADEANTFLSDYPSYSGTLIDSAWVALRNDSESLALKNSSLTIVDQVDYSSTWGGSSGISLECIDPNSDNNVSSNWGSSQTADGTPGAQNSIYSPTSITLSTLTAHSPAPQPTFFRWPWLALAVVLGGSAAARGWLGRWRGRRERRELW